MKLQTGDIVVACNPPAKASVFTSARFGADVACVSLHHEDFNGVGELSYGDKKPFVIGGPGEYEVKGIFVKGFGTNSSYGNGSRVNTVYSIVFDDINSVFLGALARPDTITNEMKENLGEVDILFVPIGGKGVLDPTQAHQVSRMLEPKLIIPVHYEGGKEGMLKVFLKEGGNGGAPLEKLTLKKKELADKEGDIVVLAPAK